MQNDRVLEQKHFIQKEQQSLISLSMHNKQKQFYQSKDHLHQSAWLGNQAAVSRSKWCIFTNLTNHPLHMNAYIRNSPCCMHVFRRQLILASREGRYKKLGSLQCNTLVDVETTVSLTASPGKRCCKIPQRSIMYLSLARPPHALEMNDTTPCGVVLISNLTVL